MNILLQKQILPFHLIFLFLLYKISLVYKDQNFKKEKKKLILIKQSCLLSGRMFEDDLFDPRCLRVIT